jgi:hypothetical protein
MTMQPRSKQPLFWLAQRLSGSPEGTGFGQCIRFWSPWAIKPSRAEYGYVRPPWPPAFYDGWFVRGELRAAYLHWMYTMYV